jgi:hypothetical protein
MRTDNAGFINRRQSNLRTSTTKLYKFPNMLTGTAKSLKDKQIDWVGCASNSAVDGYPLFTVFALHGA